VPGVYYMVAGVHVRNLTMWTTLCGMEPPLSVFFGGIFFYALSFYIGQSARYRFDAASAYRALGLILPFLVMSRLDDVFVLPAILLSLLAYESSWSVRFRAGLWTVVPTTVTILAYMTYNKITVGSAMPLSGGTKAGFVGPMAAYLTAAVHFPPILDMKT